MSFGWKSKNTFEQAERSEFNILICFIKNYYNGLLKGGGNASKYKTCWRNRFIFWRIPSTKPSNGLLFVERSSSDRKADRTVKRMQLQRLVRPWKFLVTAWVCYYYDVLSGRITWRRKSVIFSVFSHTSVSLSIFLHTASNSIACITFRSGLSAAL